MEVEYEEWEKYFSNIGYVWCNMFHIFVKFSMYIIDETILKRWNHMRKYTSHRTIILPLYCTAGVLDDLVSDIPPVNDEW